MDNFMSLTCCLHQQGVNTDKEQQSPTDEFWECFTIFHRYGPRIIPITEIYVENTPQLQAISTILQLRFWGRRKPVGRYAPTGCSHLSAEPTEYRKDKTFLRICQHNFTQIRFFSRGIDNISFMVNATAGENIISALKRCTKSAASVPTKAYEASRSKPPVQ